MGESLEQKKVRLRLIDAPKPIFEMSKAQIRELFAFKNGELHASRLIKNLIWDDHRRIARGELAPFIGNIRSYWYARVKPVLDRAGVRRFDRKYPTVINQFVALVVEERLFDYGDFGFNDDGARHRLMGRYNPHIVLAAEKIGMWPLLERVHRDMSITTIALGGHPSAMATERFVHLLLEQQLERLHLVTLVDYDPAGASIARTFAWQLQRLGFTGEIDRLDLMHPRHLTREQIKLNRYRLPQNKQTRKKNVAWAHKTGGLTDFGGERFEGLEVDALPWPRLLALIEQEIDPLLRIKRPAVLRRRLHLELVDVMRLHLERRLFG